MFNFTVVNLPSVARYWAAAFEIGGQNYWPGVLRGVGKYQDYPVAGSVDVFHVYLYDSSQNYLGASYTRSLYYGVTVLNGKDYAYNWSTGTFSEIAPEVNFSINQIYIVPQYVKPGEIFRVTFDFDYSGPQIVGGIGLKVALGTDGFLGFNEVKPVWVQTTNVYESRNYSANVQCNVPANFTPKIYDISCEIGQYPWNEGTVYDKWRMKDAVNILEPGQEPPNGEPPAPPPEPPPEDGDLKKWLPWIAIGGGGIILVGLLMRRK